MPTSCKIKDQFNVQPSSVRVFLKEFNKQLLSSIDIHILEFPPLQYLLGSALKCFDFPVAKYLTSLNSSTSLDTWCISIGQSADRSSVTFTLDNAAASLFQADFMSCGIISHLFGRPDRSAELCSLLETCALMSHQIVSRKTLH